MDNDIKEYTTPKGEKRYKFLIYVGKDETTGHTIQIKKQGFKSKDEALEAYLNYKLKIVKGEYEPLKRKSLPLSNCLNHGIRYISQLLKKVHTLLL